MSSNNLCNLFTKWNTLNEKVGERLQEFNMKAIKELRQTQRKIENQVYSSLKESAPLSIKKILPKDCGEMEVAYELTENKFYFVMRDPSYEGDELKLTGLSIDKNKNIEKINDFKKKYSQEY